MAQKTVSIQFKNPLMVTIDTKKGMKDEQILEMAQKEVLKQLKEKFPAIIYGIYEGASITLEDAHPGQIVKVKSTGQFGIICERNVKRKYPLDVVLEKGIPMQYKPVALEKVEDESIIQSLIENKNLMIDRDFGLGNRAYFVNGNNIIPVVFGKGTKTYFRAYVISGNAEGKYFSLQASSLLRMAKTKKEAEEYLAIKK